MRRKRDPSKPIAITTNSAAAAAGRTPSRSDAPANATPAMTSATPASCDVIRIAIAKIAAASIALMIEIPASPPIACSA